MLRLRQQDVPFRGFEAIGDENRVQIDVHLSPRFIQENPKKQATPPDSRQRAANR